MALRLFTSMLVVAAATALATTVASAAGCTGTEQFSDDFTQVDPAWPSGDYIAIGGGKLLLKPDAGKVSGATYGGELFGDADICVDVSIGEARDPTGPGAGMVFWHQDWNNNYSLFFSPSGSAAIIRMQNGKALTPVAWRKADSLKTGADVVNSVRITLKGTSISTYFNDQLFFTVKGFPPKGGGAIGFEAWSEDAAPNVFSFSNLKITQPK